MNECLKIEGLSVEYRSGNRHVHAVNDLDLHVMEGEVLGFVGETGAGKTTTALSILRILPNPPAKVLGGKIFFKGRNLFELSDREMRNIRGEEIAMIFQDPMTSLDPVKTVGDQICEMILLHQHCSKKEAWQKAGDMLETVGIDRERANDYPHQFSGGMKQRVVIAIALSCTPSLLIADEPTTALDVTIQAQIMELMKDLKKKYGSSMILITHDLGIVAEICDQVAIMYAGNVVEYGNVYDIYRAPHHPYTQALFDSIPDISHGQERLKVINGLPPDPANIPSGCPFHPRCPHCMERCRTEKPEPVHLNESHWARCFMSPDSAEGRQSHE